MSKCKIPMPGGLTSVSSKDSELSAKLLKEFPSRVNAQDGSSIYDQLFTQEFYDFFGQWAPTGNKKEDAKWKKHFSLDNTGLLNKQGEPNLRVRNKEYYFVNSKGEKWIVNKRFLSQKDKIETINSLGYAYLSNKGQGVRSFVKESLEKRENEFDKELAAIRVKLALEKKTLPLQEIVSLTKEKTALEAKKLSIRKDILENSKIFDSIVNGVKATLASNDVQYTEDLDVKQEDEDLREDGAGAMPKKDSSEVRDTNNIDEEIKSILSSIQEYELDPEGFESPKMSSLLNMPLAKNANTVKNRVIENASNIIELELSDSNSIQDPFNLMMNKLSERALENDDSILRDFVDKANEVLNSKSGRDVDAFKTKFVNSFYKSSNVFTITEISKEGERLILRHIDPASTQDKEALITNEFVRTIINNFGYSSSEKDISNLETYNLAKKHLSNISSKKDLLLGFKLLGLNLNPKTINSLYKNKNNVYTGVKNIGKKTLEEFIEDIFNQTVSVTIDNSTARINGLKKILESYSKNDLSIQKDIIKSISDKQTGSPLAILAAYEAKYKTDLSDSSLFVGSKQRWMLSLMSAMNKEILRWKSGNLSSLNNKKHKGLQYVNYLLAVDGIDRGEYTENSDKHKAVQKERISRISVIINSELKTKTDGSPVQHNEVGEADLHMDIFFKMFNQNDEIYDKLENISQIDKALEIANSDKSIVPYSFSADKSTFLSVKGLNPLNGSVIVNKDRISSLGVENRKIIKSYLLGEYNTMLENSNLIKKYLDIKNKDKQRDYLMKYLIPDYHYNSKEFNESESLSAEAINNGTWNRFGFFNSILKDEESKKEYSILFENYKGVKVIHPGVSSKIDDIVNIVESEIIEIAHNDIDSLNDIMIEDETQLFKKETNIKKSTQIESMYNYSVNSIFNNLEMFSLFNGDLAFYKQKGSSLSMVDALKRGPAAMTDGLYLRQKSAYNKGKYTSHSGNKIEYNKEKACIVAIANVLENDKSKYAELISEVLGKKISYTHEIADAQGFITLDFYKDAISRVYGWTEKDNTIFNNLNKKDYKPAKSDIEWLKQAGRTLQSLKFVGYGLEELKDDSGKVIGEFPVYLKYSAAVLAPALIGGTELEKLDKQMKSQGVDQLIFKSGSKGANRQATTIFNKEDGVFSGLKEDMVLNPFTFNLSNLKLQVELPTKFDKDGVLGSQHLKNLIANLKRDSNGELNDTDKDYTFRGKKISAKELHFEYEKTIKNILQAQLNKFAKAINLQENISGFEFDEMLFRDLIIDQLDINSDEDLIEILEDESLPLETIPGVAQRLFPIIASNIHKKVGKIRVNASSAIQVANIGFDMINEEDKNNIIYLSKDKELRPPLPATVKDLTQEELKSNEIDTSDLDAIVYTDEDGNISLNPKNGKMRIKKARIMLPFASIYKKTGMSYDELKSLVAKGDKFFDSEIFKNVIGYRIPNQAISSNDSIEIVGILPPQLGDTAIVYHEITAKTGSDFDIDKMYLMMPNFNVEMSNYEEAYKLLNEKIGSGDYRERMNNIRSLLKDINEEDFDGDLDEKSGRKELMTLIMSSENKENEIVKEIKSKASLKVKSIKYINDNSSKGEQNKLIELMSSILTSPKTYDDLMSPLDAEFGPKEMINEVLYLKSIINEENYEELKKEFNKNKKANLKKFSEDKELSPLEQLSAVNMVKARVDMLKAKKLVASMANHMTDVPMSQIVNQVIKYDLGVDSNNFNREFIAGKENNNEAKMTKLISYLMNAAVDAAKDNYIIAGNFNSYTVNGAMVMIRLGIDPINVFKVLLNDDILKLSNLKQLQTQKVTDIKAYDFSQETLDNYSKSFIAYLNEGNKVDFNAFIEKQEEFDSKLILGFWNIIQMAGKELNNDIVTAKSDSNGAGKNIYEHQVLLNRLERLTKESIGSEVDGNFTRGNKLIKGGISLSDLNFKMNLNEEDSNLTFLGAMMNNSLLLTNVITKNMFIENSDNYRQMVNRISNQLGDPLPISQDNIKLISNYVYPFIAAQSGHKLYNISESNVEYLQGDFLKEVMNKKMLNPENIFLKELFVDASTNLISFPNFKYFSPVDKMLLRESVEELYDQKDVKGNNIGQLFIHDLVRYSFLTTGFKPTYFSMNEFLPKSYFLNTGHGNSIDRLIGNLNNNDMFVQDEFIKKALTFIGINNESNFKIVKSFKINKRLKGDTRITDESEIAKLKITGSDNFNPFVRTQVFSRDKLISNLYMLTKVENIEKEKDGSKIIIKAPTYSLVNSNLEEVVTENNKTASRKAKVKLFDLNTIKPENLFRKEIVLTGLYIQPEVDYVSELNSIFGENNLSIQNDDVSLLKINKAKPSNYKKITITQEQLDLMNSNINKAGIDEVYTMEQFMDLSEELKEKTIECYG